MDTFVFAGDWGHGHHGVVILIIQDYIVLYNRHDKSECFIIYYEDMVSWHYEWNPSIDQLVISLVDGSVEKQEVYAKYRIEKWLNSLAPSKQAKKNYRK